MTKIQLQGKELNFAYNMKAAITFERMTGKNPLQLDQFGGDLEAMLSIAFCCLLANNEPKDVPDWDDFLTAIDDVNIMAELITKASNEMQAFFKVAKGDPQPPQPKKDKDGNPIPEEEDSKNE